MLSKAHYRYIIPKGLDKEPEQHEKSAASILADYFKTNVFFVKRAGIKTPDLMIKGSIWEIKSPIGKGKHNIQHQFSRSGKQSMNIVLDSRRSIMSEMMFKRRAMHEFRENKNIKCLVVISKKGKVVLEEYKKK